MGWVALWSAVGLIVVPVLTFLAFARANAVAGVACGPRWKSEVQARQIEWRVAPPTHGLMACPAHQVEVHMVASEEPGAGRALLAEVADEADRNGWALVLDAANDRLTAYYRDLGFEAIGPAADMPFGERVTRMVPANRLA